MARNTSTLRGLAARNTRSSRRGARRHMHLEASRRFLMSRLARYVVTILKTSRGSFSSSDSAAGAAVGGWALTGDAACALEEADMFNIKTVNEALQISILRRQIAFFRGREEKCSDDNPTQDCETGRLLKSRISRVVGSADDLTLQ